MNDSKRMTCQFGHYPHLNIGNSPYNLCSFIIVQSVALNMFLVIVQSSPLNMFHSGMQMTRSKAVT